MHEASVDGEWISGESDGGIDEETFENNTQYVCVIQDDSADEDGMASCVISLLQKGARRKIAKGEATLDDAYHTIGIICNYSQSKSSFNAIFFSGFYYYKVQEDDELPLELSGREKTGETGFYGKRQVSERVALEPGIYAIVPCTAEPGIEAEYYLRVFTETPSKLRDVPTHVADLLE